MGIHGYSSYLKSLANQKSIKIVYSEQFSGYSGKPYITNGARSDHNCLTFDPVQPPLGESCGVEV